MVSNTINLFLQMMTAPAEDEDKPERRKDKMFGEEAEEDRHQDPAKLHAAAEAQSLSLAGVTVSSNDTSVRAKEPRPRPFSGYGTIIV